MGRRRKFKYGEMAIDKGGQLWAIVDYYQDNQGRGRYRGIRVTNQYNGKLYGDSAWLEVYDLRRTIWKYKRARKVYRGNEKLPGRGCVCNCCIHVSIPAGDLTPEGEFKYDVER